MKRIAAMQKSYLFLKCVINDIFMEKYLFDFRLGK